jgi:predicted nuclease of predicted toxin-antitoxin system
MTLLYANENFPFKVVLALRNLDYDVLTSQEAGKANQSIPDDEVLAFAAQQGRALLTINRHDFIQLHKRNTDHAGIIVCTQDEDIKGQAERIHQAIIGRTSLDGELIRVHRPLR